MEARPAPSRRIDSVNALSSCRLSSRTSAARECLTNRPGELVAGPCPPVHPDSRFYCFWGHWFLHLLLLRIDRRHFDTREGSVAVVDHKVDGALQFLHASILVLRL